MPEQKEVLIVDGYNIIHAWPELKSMAQTSLEDARTALLDRLSNFQGLNQSVIIVVFDGYMVKGGKGSSFRHNGLHVVYTKEAETADRYIERMAEKMPKDIFLRVATSDALEQVIIMGKGAVRISASEFMDEVMDAEKSMREKYIENKPVKNNLLSDNLDFKTLERLESIRRKKFKG